MTTSVAGDRPGLLRRALRLEYLTVGWNIIEGLIAVTAGLASGSVALLGFGIDSFVESASGSVMIWRLLAERNADEDDEERIEHVERRAQKLVAGSLVLLAAYIAWDSITSLIAGERPEPSLVGIVLALASLVGHVVAGAREAARRDRTRQPGDDRGCVPDRRLLLALAVPARRDRRERAVRLVVGRSRSPRLA